MVVKRGVNDHQIVEAARHWRDSPNPSFHRVHGRRQHQRLAWTTDPSAEVVRGSSVPAGASDANYAGEG
jgi:hypothetical protein